ncbi:MAG TPA: DUF2795 domain-containing protein [Pseudonocardiaceae bacterium]|nr:DUF2795 domain-containing protein [Pseudonocardiaceae bacterium]
MPAYTTPDQLREALTDADFPASKEELQQTAQRNEASEETIRALRAIPPVPYHSFTEVLRSVDLVDEDPEPPAQQAQRRRLHNHPGLAEQAKDVPAANPIIDEMGENRGS